MNLYVTPHQLKDYVGVKDEDGTVRDYVPGEDRLLLDFCERASRLVERFTFRKFYPRVETRYYDLDKARMLWLDDDLLECTTLTTASSTNTITSSDYFLWPYTGYPKWRIDLDTSSGKVFYLSGTPQQANAVTGIWGYHTDWDNAWVDSGDTLAAAVSSTTATSITVANANGADVYGRSPRLQVGHTLKINSEYMYVYAKPSSTTLNVIRGVNGTTAATHSQSDTIYTYAPDADVIEALCEWGRYLFRHKDAVVTETTAFPELGAVVTPTGLPDAVREHVEQLKRRRIG